jgi:hypothetical protein
MVPCQVCSTVWYRRFRSRFRTQSFTTIRRAEPRMRHHSALPSSRAMAPSGTRTEASMTLQ